MRFLCSRPSASSPTPAGSIQTKNFLEYTIRVFGCSAQIAEALGHVRQHVTQHRERSYIELKFARDDIVEAVGVGVVPIEIVRSDRAHADPRHAVGHQRADIRTAPSGTDFAAVGTLKQ